VRDILLFIEAVQHIEEILDIGVAVVGHVVVSTGSVAKGVGGDGRNFSQNLENAL
jgi:hypothetical protein